MLKALANEKADRLPASTHTLQSYYLKTYENGASMPDFFDRHGLDRIDWIQPFKPDEARGQYRSSYEETGYGGIVSENWRISSEEVEDPDYHTRRYTVHTPDGELTMLTQSNEYTSWVRESLIKEKKDLDIIAKHVPHYICDAEEVRRHVEAIGDKGIVRSVIPPFDIYGQPGCWQDAAVLYGIENLILGTFDDPDFIKDLLQVLYERKMSYVKSLEGVPLDLIELGGGDASTTVISPNIFEEFVAPYDAPIIEAAQERGQRIVYHTCGGMMPILEQIADMGSVAMETFTPRGMGGDVDLAEAYRRIGDRVCFIGGFDQNEFFWNASPEETEEEVRRCFDACGRDGGYIISPSDHFFDAKPELVDAFARAARACTY
jgi:hypothetical protein